VTDIEYSVVEHVALILLNRPERKNAFTLDMLDVWADALRTAERDDQVRAVVLTGSGDTFCAGVDLSVLSQIEPVPLARKQMLTERVHRVLQATTELRKPLIAAINGAAVGAGLDMALAADLRFAGESARMSEGYIRIGLVPGDGGCYFLPRIVGPAKALELLLTGDFVDAREALSIGLVNRTYPDDELLRATIDFAHTLSALAPIAVSLIKRTVYQSTDMSLTASLDLISSHMAVVQSTEDYAEARAALAEMRPPVFHGR
jgi:enoyl-CoA hydratase/carnithine racemase